MISYETKRKLRELNFDEMIDILRIQYDNQPLYVTMTFDERITLVIDSLYKDKNNKRSRCLIKQAKFRFTDADRGLDKNQILEFSTCL